MASQASRFGCTGNCSSLASTGGGLSERHCNPNITTRRCRFLFKISMLRTQSWNFAANTDVAKHLLFFCQRQVRAGAAAAAAVSRRPAGRSGRGSRSAGGNGGRLPPAATCRHGGTAKHAGTERGRGGEWDSDSDFRGAAGWPDPCARRRWVTEEPWEPCKVKLVAGCMDALSDPKLGNDTVAKKETFD